ncbi:PDZ domain-containing protein [Coraliomargarita parva]|uniref:PDZ domain-containing protein n=1 Tax=Coraliomargarita parva TaxID=3014050 RepID=UPI0022B3E746|nr:hypothetical protein [Coraliomargarita parva]
MLKRHCLRLLCLPTLLTLLCLIPASAETAFDPAKSLVQIEVTKVVYDYNIPWNSRNAQTRKNGILIGDHRILTTADGLSGQYLCRVKKGGHSRQYTASVSWVDFYANIAVLDVEEAEFSQGMQAVQLADTVPQSGNLQIYRWYSGRIEERAAEIIRLYNGRSKTSYIHHLHLLVSSEIDAAGWSEVVFDGKRLIGLTTSANKSKRLTILPAPVIRQVLENHARDTPAAMGVFDFDYMYARNPALLQSRGLDRRDVGVLVTEVGRRRLAANTLKTGDIILEIDGFAIDSEGKYIDPVYGRLAMDGLSTRAHVAGEAIPMKIWRDASEQDIGYQMPVADFEKSLIVEKRYNRKPRYLMAGGLVFQPLSGPLMQALGDDKPFLLDYYSTRQAEEARKNLILLTMVLPDDYNEGYQSLRYMIVDQINGQAIQSLEDIETALQSPVDGFHSIRFMHDMSASEIVLDATTMSATTKRLLQHYHIPAASSF